MNSAGLQELASERRALGISIINLGKGWSVIGAAAVHAIQHQALQVDVQLGYKAKAPDHGDRAAMAFVGLEIDTWRSGLAHPAT